MRKIKQIALLAGLILGVSVSARAWIFEQVPDKNVTVRYRLSVAAALSTATIAIDLSDTTNWPHKETGEINISAIRVDIDKVAASSATVKLGVVNFVNSSTGSVTWFYGREFSKNVSNTDVSHVVNYAPNFMKLRVNPGSNDDNGTTPYLFSNDTTNGSAIYQNDVFLPSPLGNDKPGVGDIILAVNNTDYARVIIVSIEIQYHANKR